MVLERGEQHGLVKSALALRVICRFIGKQNWCKLLKCRLFPSVPPWCLWPHRAPRLSALRAEEQSCAAFGVLCALLNIFELQCYFPLEPMWFPLCCNKTAEQSFLCFRRKEAVLKHVQPHISLEFLGWKEVSHLNCCGSGSVGTPTPRQCNAVLRASWPARPSPGLQAQPSHLNVFKVTVLHVVE